MSALARGQGRLHAGRAAARDEHGLGGSGRQRMARILLEANLRVDRAPVLTVASDALEALEAADARPDLVGLVGPRLLGEVGIGHEGPGGQHHVGLAGGDDLLHETRVVERPDHANGGLDVLLEFGRVLHVGAIGQEDARTHQGEDLRPLVHADRRVDEIHLAVKLHGDLDTLVDAEPALVAGRRADAHVDGKAPSALLLDALRYGEHDAAAVFNAAAPLVFAMVDGRVEELAEQPAVAGMEGHHPEAAELRKRGRVGKGLDSLQDHLFRHGRHEHTEGVLAVHGAVDLVAAPGRVVGVGAAVLQLHRRYTAVPADGLRQPVDGRQRLRIVEVGVALPHAGTLAVGNRRAHVHGGRPAGALALEEGDGLLDRVLLRRQILVTYGRVEDAVLEDRVPQADRREQVGILTGVHERYLALD